MENYLVCILFVFVSALYTSYLRSKGKKTNYIFLILIAVSFVVGDCFLNKNYLETILVFLGLYGLGALISFIARGFANLRTREKQDGYYIA